MRRRLALAIVGVASVAVVLFALPLGAALRSAHTGEELARLQRDTVAATRGIDISAARADPVELPSTEDVVGVYDRSGRRIAGRGPVRADALVRDALATGRSVNRAGDGRLLVAVPLSSHERLTGAVRSERDDAALEKRVRRQWLAIAALGLALVAAAGLAAWMLGRRLTRPLERLVAVARRLGDGDFSIRSPHAGVPEVDALGQSLDATASRLDELVTREREFSADASHQMRTPLAALRLELEALELRGAGSPESSAALGQVERLEATIETLLALVRDGPRGDSTADLAELLRAAEARWRGSLSVDGRQLRTRVDDTPAVAAAAPQVITEVLDVLLQNAQVHGKGAVTIGLRRVGDWLAVEVGDEGPGFGDHAEAAFVRRESSGDGHGIGLALARSLAAAEGGSLAVTRSGPSPLLTLLLRAA